MHRAAEVAVLGKVVCRAEQHGRVAVVTARVHFAFVPGAMLELVDLG